MSKIIFRLKNVPDDEAQEVRDLFQDNHIETFETSAGNWGVSLPAIWLKNDSQFSLAKKLLEDYQQQRYITARKSYETEKASGNHKTLWDSFKEQPLKFTAYTSIAMLVFYLSIKFAFDLGQGAG